MKLHEMREHLAQTQAELAHRLEIGFSTYARFESLHKKGGTVPNWLVFAVTHLFDASTKATNLHPTRQAPAAHIVPPRVSTLPAHLAESNAKRAAAEKD